MSIKAQSDRTPVADMYRAYVLEGLDELQGKVDAAGGIEAFVRGSAPRAKLADILWDGKVVSVVSIGEIAPDTGGVYIKRLETEPTTEVGTIQLASWWRSMPEVLSPVCSEMSDYAGSVEDVRRTWLSCLYPADDPEVEQLVVAMLSKGQMPLSIELEAVWVTLEALTGLQYDEYLAFLGNSWYSHVIAEAIVDYYLVQKKAPCPAPSPDQEDVIWNWVMQGSSELQAAYLASQ